jgi:hypothetical protein
LMETVGREPKVAPSAGLSAGIARLADRLGVPPADIEATMAGFEGPETAWKCLLVVLEAAAPPASPEGRGGHPLSAAEAGLDRHIRAAQQDQVDTVGRAGDGPKKHWWSRR